MSEQKKLDSKLARNFGAVVKDMRGEDMFNSALMDQHVFSRVLAKLDTDGRQKLAAAMTECGVQKLTLCVACLEALRFVPDDKRTRSAKEIQEIGDLMRKINKEGWLRITPADRDKLKDAVHAYFGRQDPWAERYINDLLEGAEPELADVDEVSEAEVIDLQKKA